VECVVRKFVKLINIEFHENLLWSSWVVTCTQKDGWTDKAELLDTFLQFFTVNVSKMDDTIISNNIIAIILKKSYVCNRLWTAI
jgi:hypothetical protein